MPQQVENPVRVPAHRRMLIDQYVGRASTESQAASVAPSTSTTTAACWRCAGQAVLTKAREWVRYVPLEGAAYVAVCLPALAPDTAHRQD